MSAVTSWFAAVGGLLVLGGALKLASPRLAAEALSRSGVPGGRRLVRLGALGEIALGIAAPATGYLPLAALTAVTYATFTAYAFRRWSRGAAEGCGCFGSSDVPASAVHVVVNGAATGLAVVALAGRAPSLPDALVGQPMMGLPMVALIVTTVVLLYGLLTVVPQLGELRARLRSGARAMRG